jgi:hypothetical protein
MLLVSMYNGMGGGVRNIMTIMCNYGFMLVFQSSITKYIFFENVLGVHFFIDFKAITK